MSEFDSNKHSKKVKLLITLGCCYIYVVYGLTLAIPTTAIFDIAYLVQAEVAEVSYGFTINSVVYTIGALISWVKYFAEEILLTINYFADGYLFKRYIDRRKALIFSLVLSAIRLATIPLTRSLVFHYILTGIQGFTAAVFDVAINAWILDLWREKCNTYMQALHFSVGLGMAVGPFILAPFVGIDPKMNRPSNSVSHPFDIVIEINGTTGEEEDVPIGRFSIPFIGAGLACVLSVCLQIWLYIMEERVKANHGFSRTQDAGDMYEIDVRMEESTSERLKPRQSKTVLFLGAIILFTYLGMEINAFSFVTTYIVYFGYSVQEGANQAIILTAAFALFRLIAIFLSKKLTATSLIFIHLILLFVSGIILLFFSTVSLTWISLGLFTFGAGCSVFFPSTYSMIEQLIPLNNASVSILLFSGAIASAFYPIFMPSLLELCPMYYVYLNVVSTFLVAIFIFILLIKFGSYNLPLLKSPKETFIQEKEVTSM